MADPTVKKMAEATKDGKTELITLWDDQLVSLCEPVNVPNDLNFADTTFECETKVPSNEGSATQFFEELGKLSRAGYTVKVLYDAESITTESELGDVRSLLSTGRLPG